MIAMADPSDVLAAIVRHCDSGGTLQATSPLVVLAQQAVSAHTTATSATRGGEGESAPVEPDHAPSPPGCAKNGGHFLQTAQIGLSQEQIEVRRHTLGASEIASVVGVNPWQTVHAVWSSKCLGIDFEGNEATYLGNFLESSILALYSDRYDVRLKKGSYLKGPESWTSCTPDAHQIDGQNALVEAKLVGLRSLWMWGPSNTDDNESDAVPLHYLCQAQWQAMVTGVEYVDIAALMGTEFRTYRIRSNKDVQDSDVYAGNVNADVSLAAEVTGRTRIAFTAYDVDCSAPTAAISTIRIALATPGLGIGYGIWVDIAFENWTPSQGPLDGPADLSDPNGGGHWICGDAFALTGTT